MPRDRSDAEEVGVLPGLYFLLLLGTQGNEAELRGGIHGGGRDEVLRQVLQVLLPRPSGHRSKLL